MNTHLKKNQAPGSYIYTGDKLVDTQITHVVYNEQTLEVRDDLNFDPRFNHWLMFKGLKDTEKIKSICESYGVDPLIIEDIFNVTQRNKIEYYTNYVFAVFSYAYYVNEEIKHDYFSLLLFQDKLLTFHEHNTYLFDQMYIRLQNNKGLIRKGKHDYLFYVVLDTILDNDIYVFRELSMKTIKLEEDIIQYETVDQSLFYASRKEYLFLKKTIDPIYDSFSRLEYKNSSLISKEIDKYFKDVLDHMKRINDDIASERELIRNLLDVQMNNVSNKMNQVMKTLTIFSAIFIPLSFLTGIFGMNFIYFDILKNPFGLTIFFVLCAVISITMLLYFKKKHWF